MFYIIKLCPTRKRVCIMKKILYCLLCVSACLLVVACDDKSDGVAVVPDDNKDNSETVVKANPSASLTYVFSCDSDLVAFVTPEIIYTDSLGSHSVILDEKTWAAETVALCYKTEDGKTTYTGIPLDENGKVPEPWIIESYISQFLWSNDVHLNKVDIINDCMVRFHRKADYVIAPNRQYKLSYSINCTKGQSSLIVDGKIVYDSFNFIAVGSNDKAFWEAHEVENYINELCTKTVTVSMRIDSNGTITKVSQ